MKGNLAFKLIFQPKAMAFSPLSFTENISAPFITVSPQTIIILHFANLAKKSAVYTAFASSKLWEHRKSRASSSGSPAAPQPALPTRELRGPGAPGVPPDTQGDDGNVSLLPSCGHATTSQSPRYFTKKSIFFYRRIARAWLFTWVVSSAQM